MAWTRDAVDQEGRRRPGQVSIVQMYRRYSGISDEEYRLLLHQVTGCRSSRDESLDQHAFDRFMARLEVRAHLAETNGLAAGPRPTRIRAWYYWRNRCPSGQRPSSRELWKVDRVWALLLPYLPAEQQSHEYLRSIAAHAIGRRVDHVHSLSQHQVLNLIDALTDRLAHAVRRGAPAA
jgi:hypothetical protein